MTARFFIEVYRDPTCDHCVWWTADIYAASGEKVESFGGPSRKRAKATAQCRIDTHLSHQAPHWLDRRLLEARVAVKSWSESKKTALRPA